MPPPFFFLSLLLLTFLSTSTSTSTSSLVRIPKLKTVFVPKNKFSHISVYCFSDLHTDGARNQNHVSGPSFPPFFLCSYHEFSFF